MYFKCLLCKGDRKDMRSKVELDHKVIKDWTLKSALSALSRLFPNVEIEGSSKKACKKCFQRIKYFLEFSEIIKNPQNGLPSLNQQVNDNDVDEEMPEAPATNAETSQQQNPVDAIDDDQAEPTSEAQKDSPDLESFDELRKKYEALKRGCEELEKDKQTQHHEYQLLTVKNSILKKKVDSLRQQMDDAIENFQSLKAWKDLQDEKEKLSKMLQEEKDQHQKIVNENNRLKRELETLEKNQTALEEKCEKLKTNHKIAEDQLANSQFSMLEREKEWQQDNEKLELRVKDLKKQKGELEEELTKMKKEKGKVDKFKKVKKNLEAEISKRQSYKRRLTRAEKEVSELKEKNSQLIIQQITKIDFYKNIFEAGKLECGEHIKGLDDWRKTLPNVNETSNQKEANTTKEANDTTLADVSDIATTRNDPINKESEMNDIPSTNNQLMINDESRSVKAPPIRLNRANFAPRKDEIKIKQEVEDVLEIDLNPTLN